MYFDDVPAGYPGRGEINALTTRGVALGTSTNLFSPLVTMTVGEVDSWLMRGLATRPVVGGAFGTSATRNVGVEPMDTALPQLASDVPPAHPYFGYVQQAIKVGIHGGPERANFDPGEVEGGGGTANPFSLAFDQSASWVSGGTTGLNGAVDFTVSLWVKVPPHGAPATAFIASNDDDASPSKIILGINGTGTRRVIAEMYGAGGGFASRILFSTTAITDNVWHHLVMTRSGAAAFFLYVDGVGVMGATCGGTALSILTGYIGAYNSDGTDSRYWKGNIDDVRVYTRALTEGEIQDLTAGRDVDSTGLVNWWKFNEGTGTSASDSGTGGDTGTLVGAGVTWSVDVPVIGSGSTTAPTRGLACVFLVRSLGLEPLVSATPRFADVLASHDYYGYIERAAASGIIGVSGQTVFQPDDPLLRYSLAIFIHRAYNVAIIPPDPRTTWVE